MSGGDEVYIHAPETWARFAGVQPEHVEQLVRSAGGGVGSAADDSDLSSDEDEHEGGDAASGYGPQNPVTPLAAGLPPPHSGRSRTPLQCGCDFE